MARKKKEEEQVNTGEWLNTYADMITLVLTFFVMLLAASNTDASKLQAIASYFNPSISILNSGQTIGDGSMIGNGVAQMPNYEQALNETTENTDRETVENNKKMVSDFQTYFEENNLTSKIDVAAEMDYVKISFKDGVLFDKSKAILKPEAIEILNILLDQLLKYPNTDISVEGHTDNDKINSYLYPSNWELSAARASSVARYYIEQKGFSPERMTAIGYGEYRPIASNDTLEGQAQNRRVELKIMQRNSSK